METTAATDTLSYGTTMSLRIWHPRLRSDEITNAVGLPPSLHNDVGAPRKTPTGQPLDGVYAQTYWLRKFDFAKDAEVEDCIVKVLDALKTKWGFLKQIASTGGRCELFIGVFLEKNAGIELNESLVRQVADAGLGLSFDLYVPGP